MRGKNRKTKLWHFKILKDQNRIDLIFESIKMHFKSTNNNNNINNDNTKNNVGLKFFNNSIVRGKGDLNR